MSSNLAATKQPCHYTGSVCVHPVLMSVPGLVSTVRKQCNSTTLFTQHIQRIFSAWPRTTSYSSPQPMARCLYVVNTCFPTPGASALLQHCGSAARQAC